MLLNVGSTMIGRNLAAFRRMRNLAGLSCPVNDLHYSCRQCLCNNASPPSAPVRLAYAKYESLSDSSKPPILIMHGLFGSKSNWNSISRMVQRNTKRKIIAVDARNHGDSPHTISMSYNDMASDVIFFLNNYGYEKVALVGHSMGGSAMMYTALNFPHYAEKLVVVDMSPIRASPKIWQMMIVFEALRSVNVNASSTLSEARQMADKQLARFIESTELRQFLTTNLVHGGPENYRWRINLPVLEQVFSTQIAVFPSVVGKVYKGPTLFIGGAKSNYIRVEDQDNIKLLFPYAEFTYIEDADHWVHADKPVEFIKILTQFMNRPTPQNL